MSETPDSSRTLRPRTRVGRPFVVGNPGKKRGARDHRTIVGIEAARAMSGRAFDRLADLVNSRSHRVSLEASKLILAYAWGLPKQTLELAGGFGNLAAELSAALAEARARRAALDAGQGAQGCVQLPPALPTAPAEPASEGK